MMTNRHSVRFCRTCGKLPKVIATDDNKSSVRCEGHFGTSHDSLAVAIESWNHQNHGALMGHIDFPLVSVPTNMLNKTTVTFASKKKPKIIGLGHRKHKGKDALYDALRLEMRQHDEDVHVCRVSLADPLKDFCHQLYGSYGLQNKEYYERNPEKKNETIPKLGMSARDIWIKVGNDLRGVHSDLWLDLAMRYIDVELNKGNPDSGVTKLCVVTDVRYLNEAERIKEAGGILVKVEREGVANTDDPADSALEGYSDWDAVVNNDGDLSELLGAARVIYERYGWI